jgi:hypothetical protein
VRVCERHGRSLDKLDDDADEFALDQPALAACYGAVNERQLVEIANEREAIVRVLAIAGLGPRPPPRPKPPLASSSEVRCLKC